MTNKNAHYPNQIKTIGVKSFGENAGILQKPAEHRFTYSSANRISLTMPVEKRFLIMVHCTQFLLKICRKGQFVPTYTNGLSKQIRILGLMICICWRFNLVTQ